MTVKDYHTYKAIASEGYAKIPAESLTHTYHLRDAVLRHGRPGHEPKFETEGSTIKMHMGDKTFHLIATHSHPREKGK